jgi:hypothetical protein
VAEDESEECVIGRRVVLWFSVVRAKLIIMMSDNLVVDRVSFGVLITNLCTDFESWH